MSFEQMTRKETQQHGQALQRNNFPPSWLYLYRIILNTLIFVFFLSYLNYYEILELSNLKLEHYFYFLLADSFIQLKFIEKLWRSKRIGLYGLIIMFALRLVMMIEMDLLATLPLYLIDAILLCIAVYTSRTKNVTEKAKRKRKVKA